MTTEIAANGVKYTTVTYRGTEYTLRRGDHGWELTTRRIGYGDRFHIGGFKRFDTLSALQAKCKAFAGFELAGVL